MSHLFDVYTKAEVDAMVAGAGVPIRLARLSATFDGTTVEFTDMLPAEPDIATNEVLMFHAGVGMLKRVASAPAAGQFSLSAGTDPNRTVTFGLAPSLGEEVYVAFALA